MSLHWQPVKNGPVSIIGPRPVTYQAICRIGTQIWTPPESGLAGPSRGDQACSQLGRGSQAGIFNITRDICGEARIVERVFGLGPSALAEAVEFVGEQLQLEAD